GGILDIDRLVPRLELVGDEFEGARPDGIGDLLVGIGLGEPFGHDERRYARDLGQTRAQQRERLLPADREALIIAPDYRVDHRSETLAQRVASHPAPERGDAIGAADRRAVVELEAVA